ncbi:hypothetical protein L6452_19845 [Arctium lappa]|uniref:Uncharacterized protein n=1 Tax=Arctium lappa TaxID=4217 RepID=A0ACB9BE39_ARCLA|nr:hypothetical protein L6452_19845 [Arctium lappa]
MDNKAAKRSCEEDYSEYQLQTKQPQQKTQEADKQNTIIHQKENENNEDNDAEVHKDDSLYGVTDSDEESMDPQDLPEYTYVNINKARRLLGCELCQGLMRKVNVIKPCLHSICAICINKCIKLGKKKCPVCGTNYSAIAEDEKLNNIAAVIFPETEKSEAQASEHPTDDKQCNRRKLVNDKKMRHQVKRPRCTMADSCSTMSQSVPSSSKSPPELSDEMLDRVAKRVVAAILKQQKKHQQPPHTHGKK